MGSRFVRALRGELQGVWPCRCNMEHFTIFQRVILQRTRPVTRSYSIRQRIVKRIDVREAGHHQMFVEEMACTCKQYIFASCRNNLEQHEVQTFYNLVLMGKLRNTNLWVIYHEK